MTKILLDEILGILHQHLVTTGFIMMTSFSILTPDVNYFKRVTDSIAALIGPRALLKVFVFHLTNPCHPCHTLFHSVPRSAEPDLLRRKKFLLLEVRDFGYWRKGFRLVRLLLKIDFFLKNISKGNCYL